MNHSLLSFWPLADKSAIVHTVTYFFIGLLSMTLFNYRELYSDASVKLLMRQVNDPVVMTGPLFQPLRGLLFAIAFFPFRQTIFDHKKGWLLIALLLIVLGVVATFGPAPGSVEGLIYTVLPIRFQLIGLPEVLIQALVYSFLLHWWVNHPRMRILSWGLSTLFVIILLLVLLGILTTNK